MKAELGIILFFLTVGIISAWFHWYFVGSHRLRLVENNLKHSAVLEVGKTYWIYDVSIFEIMPNGDMIEVKYYGEDTLGEWSDEAP